MELYDQKVNDRLHPVGIDGTPFFSWKIRSDKRDTLQTAYRVQVPGVWDSGRVESRKQAYVEYAGDILLPLTEYHWTVTVWDNHGNCTCGSGCFETASPEWKAQWVESTLDREEGINEYISRYLNGEKLPHNLRPGAPAVLFERCIWLKKERIIRARVYATVFGVYRLLVNGVRPDDREFAPEFTSYDKLHYYQTYDVTALLSAGENTLSMYVADGWYFSEQASPATGELHKAPSVLFQLEIWYADGTRDTICSNGQETCATGFVVSADNYIGESQDLNLSFENQQPVAVRDYGYDTLTAQPMDSVRPMRLLPAVDLFVTPKGEMVVDFGQVIAGRARINLNLPRGQKAIFRYFEVLDDQGCYINTMFAPQTDWVISNGVPLTYEALFTFHGFRYIMVEGVADACKEDFIAVLLTSEQAFVGDFECSEPRLNRLYQNIRWSALNNMMSIPTDCPTRERAGWTCDLLVFARTALLHMNMRAFLASWLRNVRAEQREDGVITVTAPYAKLYWKLIQGLCASHGDNAITNVAGWSDAIVWVPYDMYQVTGDELILKDCYPAMVKFCNQVIDAANRRGEPWLFNTGFHFGEWLIPSEPSVGFDACKNSSFYAAPMFAYMSMVKMAQICDVLGENAEPYANAAERMKTAILSGISLPDKMGAYVLAIAFHLVPKGMETAYRDNLLRLIAQNNDTLDTGFLATPFLLDALCEVGEWETARKIFWQNRMPSWLYEVEHGATTIWEAWDADEATHGNRYVSFDHYAFGCVDDWIMRKLCGIDSKTPGFTHILIEPVMDENIRWLRRSFDTVHGLVETSYHQNELTVTIPANATATVKWNGSVHEVGSGSYHFS